MDLNDPGLLRQQCFVGKPFAEVKPMPMAGLDR